jgi:tetratricopeptide (TPR) repeat protein
MTVIDPLMRVFPERGTRVFAYAALVLGVLVAFVLPGALSMGWNWDDRQALLENPAIREFLLGRIFSEDYWASRGGAGMYRPLTALSLSLDLQLFGEDPLALHRSNLLLHLLACLFLAGFLNRLRPGFFGVAFLILYLHPVAAGQAVWISGRSGALMLACVGLGLWLAHAGRLWWATLALLLGSLCREDAILVLLLLPIVAPRERGELGLKVGLPAVLGPIFAGLLVFTLLRLLVLGELGAGESGAGERFGPIFARACDLFGHSWRQLLLLEDPRLFSDEIASSGVFGLLFPLALLALPAVFFWGRSDRVPLRLGVVWMLLAFAPLSGLTGLGQGVTGRYAYALLPALLALLASDRLLGRLPRRRMGMLLLPATLLLPFGAAAAVQYSSELASYERILDEEPDNRRARLLLALAYENAGVRQAAIRELRELTRRHPGYSRGFVNLGRLVWEEGDIEGARLVLTDTATRFGKSSRASLTLGRFEYEQKQWEAAQVAFERALRVNPREGQAARYLVRCALRLDQLEEAERWLREARAIAPSHPSLAQLTRQLEEARR